MVPLETTLSFAQVGLASSLGLDILQVSILNVDTLECRFRTKKTKALDIKVEIGGIMGFLGSFFKDDPYNGIRLTYFAVRAYDDNGQELLYALSSTSSASLASEGKAIEWLKSTLFQENTHDYRLAVAKRYISEIETNLRIVVRDTLKSIHSNEWWETAVDAALQKDVLKVYETKFDLTTTDGDTLIEYTYIPQLASIIKANWPQFQIFFEPKEQFEDAIKDFNRIRREEAHNRNISDTNLNELKLLYYQILASVADKFPNISWSFLVENWRLKIRTIFEKPYKALYSAHELASEPNDGLKLKMSIEATKHLVEYLNYIIIQLRSVIVPIEKRAIHEQLVQLFVTSELLQQKKVADAMNNNLQELEATVETISQHEAKLARFANQLLATDF